MEKNIPADFARPMHKRGLYIHVQVDVLGADHVYGGVRLAQSVAMPKQSI